MKLMILFAAVSLSLLACGQDIPACKVPSIVQNTVQTTFTNTGSIEWEKKNNVYEAEFDKDNTEYTAYLDAGGKIIAYKLDIKENELPAAVTAVITRDYTGYRIDDAAKIQKDGITFYRVELEAKGKRDKKLFLSQDGKIAPPISYIH